MYWECFNFKLKNNKHDTLTYDYLLNSRYILVIILQTDNRVRKKVYINNKKTMWHYQWPYW